MKIFTELAGLIMPFFVFFCFAIYWAGFVRLIFFVFRLKNSIAMAWISFSPLYVYLLYLFVAYVLDQIIFLFAITSKNYFTIKDYINYLIASTFGSFEI